MGNDTTPPNLIARHASVCGIFISRLFLFLILVGNFDSEFHVVAVTDTSQLFVMGGSILNIWARKVRLAWLGGGWRVFTKTIRIALFSRVRCHVQFFSGTCYLRESVITLGEERNLFIAPRTGLSPHMRRPAGDFFSLAFTQARCVSVGRSGNNIVKVAVTPKTTKCRLSHRTLQAATAKYRRAGPPAVIARHSSPRERHGVCAPSLYTRGGFALAAPPATFFVTFAKGGPSHAHVRSFAPPRWTH